MTPGTNTSVASRNEADGPLTPGTRFGKFDIIKRIGRGGYASVYHAFDTILQRDVAIKVLHRVGGVSDDMLRRGVVEAQLMCQLRHPNIVQVYDANITESGLLYLVMELLVGRTLFQVLRHYERLAVEEACAIGIQIADAVEVAHQSGAIHRDLKPENVFITDGNVVKVLDFGIAKMVHGAKGNTTRPDAIQGTVLYMSPEQIGGHKLTVRCDIYALGNILFELLYGQHPCLLKNPDPDTLAVAWLQTYEIAPPLEDIAPYCPRHLSRIVSQAMAKRADERQASMKDLKQVLEASLTRFLKESGGGELKGKVRNLAGTTPSSSDAIFESQEGGRFPWYSKAIPVLHDTAPNDGPPASTDVKVPRVDAQPVVAPVSTPRPAAKAPKRRASRTVMVAILVMAPLGGSIVAGGLTKLYLARKHAAPAPTTSVEPIVVLPPVSTSVPAVTAPPPPVPAVASAVVNAPVPVAAVAKPTARPASKPKKIDASEARLRALEAELNNGTLGVTPPR